MAGAFASRLCGSADIYEHSGKAPVNSINFVTCHDGFTLNDLVSYEHKHNLANGEDNRDGCFENFSANHGHEGSTDDLAINALRARQMKNLLVTLFVSRGVPMMLGGDEFRRTQQGNNNAYCQDNELSWFDWGLLDRNREFFTFVQGLIAFRKRYPVLSRESFYQSDEISWFNPLGQTPDWHEESAIGCHIHPQDGGQQLCLLANPTTAQASFDLPPPPAARRWVHMLDTGALPPLDLCQPGKGRPVAPGALVTLRDRSLVVLVAASSR
jgi:glycogen operon protein